MADAFMSDFATRAIAERLFFGYRAFTGDADRVLASRGLGRAHHRALYFIERAGSIPVHELLATLGITKQALTRVLRELMDARLVERRRDPTDGRRGILTLTDAGRALELSLLHAQRARIESALQRAGPSGSAAVHAFLEALMEPDDRDRIGTTL